VDHRGGIHRSMADARSVFSVIPELFKLFRYSWGNTTSTAEIMLDINVTLRESITGGIVDLFFLSYDL